MREQHGKTSRLWEPQRDRQEVDSPEAQLPEGDVVFLLLAIVPQLAVSRFYAPDETATRGAPPCDPALMVCLLLDAYCVGVLSSRKIALAGERHLAFLTIVGQDRPDFRPISDVRQRHLEAFKEVFVQVVRLAGEAGLVHLGNVATDGPKIQGNAARPKAISDGSMQKEVERLREEIETWVTQASQQDAAAAAVLGSRRGAALPAALARREDRLATIEAAMHRLEARAKAEAERARTGTTRRGKGPAPVDDTPAATAPTNVTDPERPLMQTKNQGWEDGGHAHVSVDGACQILIACDVTDASNDTQQAAPVAQATLTTLAQAGIERPTDASGVLQPMPATWDRGDDSEAAAQALEDWGFDPSRATGRQKPHAPEAEASDVPATAQERMAAQGRTPDGKAVYARRKVIVEPVLGQIKAVRGFRRFLLRGWAKIRGEWRLGGLTPHLLKLWRYGCAPLAA
jgi:transposase